MLIMLSAYLFCVLTRWFILFFTFSEISQLIPHDSFSSHPYYYSCQCKEGYGFENCTETSDSGGSINFGHTYCQKDQDNITINSLSDTQPLIFIDHVAYGSPLEPPEYSAEEDQFCEGSYATSIDKVGRCKLNFTLQVRVRFHSL